MQRKGKKNVLAIAENRGGEGRKRTTITIYHQFLLCILYMPVIHSLLYYPIRA